MTSIGGGLGVLGLVACLGAASSAERMAVVSYLPEWRYEGAHWPTISAHTSHLILFSLEPTPDGRITGKDRIPRPELLAEAKAAAQASGTRLMLCFGGNGRSSGFSRAVRSPEARGRFVGLVAGLLAELGLDGVDYNWEYPGYQFGRGYLQDTEVAADYKGLAALVTETRAALGPGPAITLAYYPDGRQERLLREHGVDRQADLLHAMAYDAQGGQHSSLQLFEASLTRARAAELPLNKVTVGVPFYGRFARTGDWRSYEDLVQRHWPLEPETDSVQEPELGQIGFNGRAMIERKSAMAARAGAAGVMIWEVGQDCRLEPVVRAGAVAHVATCPDPESSLLLAVTRGWQSAGRELDLRLERSASKPDL